MQLLYKKTLPTSFIQNPRQWNLFSREKSFLRFVVKNYGNSTITKVPSHFVVLSEGKFSLQPYYFWKSVSFTEGLIAWSSRQTFTSRVWSAVERNICDDCVCSSCTHSHAHTPVGMPEVGRRGMKAGVVAWRKKNNMEDI